MAAARKYEGLPDIDASAPDVYETPELIGDVSTLQETSIRSPSEGSDADHGIRDTGVDRRRTKALKARSKFRSSRVNAGGVDFSDRLSLAQRSYRTINGRGRPSRYDYEAEEFGDVSDEDDEPLDRKLARLRREVEQVKTVLEEQRESQIENNDAAADDDALSNIQKISESLDSIHATRRGDAIGAEADLQRKLKSFSDPIFQKTTTAAAQARDTTLSAQPTTPHLLQSLSKASNIDERLHVIETALGLSTLSPEDDSTKLIIPTLHSLEQLIGLATAQPEMLDKAHAKNKKLWNEFEAVNKYREQMDDSKKGSSFVNGSYPEDAPEQVSRVNALYGLLPTVDSLAPSLPFVLDRLRSLRLLHGSAAGAQSIVQDVEKRQSEQAQELIKWKKALDQVEKQVIEGEKSLADNMKEMGDWIRELEKTSNI